MAKPELPARQALRGINNCTDCSKQLYRLILAHRIDAAVSWLAAKGRGSGLRGDKRNARYRTGVSATWPHRHPPGAANQQLTQPTRQQGAVRQCAADAQVQQAQPREPTHCENVQQVRRREHGTGTHVSMICMGLNGRRCFLHSSFRARRYAHVYASK